LLKSAFTVKSPYPIVATEINTLADGSLSKFIHSPTSSSILQADQSKLLQKLKCAAFNEPAIA
jgi:hypothetical protein